MQLDTFASATITAHAPIVSVDPPPLSEEIQLAQISPAAGIVQAWIDVERELRRWLFTIGKTSMMSPFGVVCRDAEAVPPYIRGLILDLAQLRHEAAHGTDQKITTRPLWSTSKPPRLRRERFAA